MDDPLRQKVADLLAEAEPLTPAGDVLDGWVVAFAHTRARLVTLVELLTERSGPPVLLVIDSETKGILSRRHGWFEVTTRASDLVADDRLQIRETDLPVATPTVVGNERLTTIGALSENTVELSEPLSDNLRDGLAELVRRADRYDPPLPGLDAITDGLETAVDPAVADDFTATVASATGMRDDVDGLLLLLLVAALHRLRWNTVRELAVDIGLSSATPLRQRKARLLRRGLIRERPDTTTDERGRPPKTLCFPKQFDLTPDDGVPDVLLRRVVNSP